jgi:hypothetical protein
VFLVYRNPLPIPDRGHRGFVVPNERAAITVVTILSQAGLPEQFSFDSGPIHHTLLWDNATAIMRFDESLRQLGIGLNFMSIVVADPGDSATRATTLLEESGFTAKVWRNTNPALGDKLVVVSSSAFEGWVMVFRRHKLLLGAIKRTRLLPR